MKEPLSEIKNFYVEAFVFFDKTRETPEIEVEFYPYIGIKHTIRVRNGKVFVRLSDICRGLPLAAHRALAFILVAKLLRKKVPLQASKTYSKFIKNPEIQKKSEKNKRERGRKIVTSSKGKHYDLDEIFEKMNKIYFQNSLVKPTLTWSVRRTYRILGHHDAAHQTIVISRSLDSPKVPPYVVEFVVFHEMLHIFHPTELRNGRRLQHTPAFRRDERKFRCFEKAENWIKENVRQLDN
jgi:predicted metal-dependent hydrolase